MRPRGRLLVPLLVVAGLAPIAAAHERPLTIPAERLRLRVDGPRRALALRATGPRIALPTHDPAAEETSLLVVGTGPDAGRTALIRLDPSRWRGNGGRRGFRYRDRRGTRGGVRKIVLRPGRLVVKARGRHLPWGGGVGNLEGAWVLLRVEDEVYCAHLSGRARRGGRFRARAAPAPAACPAALCGNGILEPGEACDDGNLADADGCTTVCTRGVCQGERFETTLAAIEATIFGSPTYGCTAGPCHSSAAREGGLDLSPGAAHASLVGVPAKASVGGLRLVEPGEPERSFLYTKLAWATLGTAADGGAPMPVGTPPLAPEHLDAVARWIRGGAPADRVVEGTAEQLASCLPEPDPLVIPVPDAPPVGTGIQLRQTAWALPATSENEICMATFYDLTATALVPESAKVPCPGRWLGPANPSGECFAYRRTTLWQDPQSHHSIVRLYAGEADVADPSWGPWTHKLQDRSDPRQGEACDPRAVDATIGSHPGCSSEPGSAVACIGYGPVDLSLGLSVSGASSDGAPSFSGSQEPYYRQTLVDGVYDVLPMQGIVVWNSHAFNLTATDTTMSQYLNVEFAPREDQRFRARGIFDSDSIFVQYVPPFETREYCRTYTLPRHARLFELGSHTHRRGVLFRVWAPPHDACEPGDPTCVPPDDPARLVYVSTDYSDPLQLRFDPPIAHDGEPRASRTYLYCSLYDNGSTPESPPVKRLSTSPDQRDVFGSRVAPGGPCTLGEVVCLGGPQHGAECLGDDAVCAPAGVCDACPVQGGISSEDEMLILLGSYYVDAP